MSGQEQDDFESTEQRDREHQNQKPRGRDGERERLTHRETRTKSRSSNGQKGQGQRLGKKEELEEEELEAEEHPVRRCVAAWPGAAAQLLTGHICCVRRPSRPLFALEFPRASGNSACSPLSDMGKLRPREEAVLAHILSSPQPRGQSSRPVLTAVCPQASCSPSRG